MKGRRAGGESLAPVTLSRVPPFTLFQPSLPFARHPFLSAVFPMGNVVTYRSSWKPAPIEMETQPWDAHRLLSLSLSPPLYSASPTSLFALHPSPATPTCQRVFASRSLSVVPKLSLAPSCSFLPPGAASLSSSSEILSPTRFPVARSR